MSDYVIELDFLCENGFRAFINLMRDQGINYSFGIHWKPFKKFVHFVTQEDLNYVKLMGWIKKNNSGDYYFDIFAACETGGLE